MALLRYFGDGVVWHKVAKMKWVRPIWLLQAVLWLGVMFFSYRPLEEAWKRNQWSLAFFAAQSVGNRPKALPPPSHFEAPVWVVAPVVANDSGRALSPFWEGRLQVAATRRPAAALLLGWMYYRRGNVSEAIRWWQRFHQIRPLLQAASDARRQGDDATAGRLFQAAYEMDPEEGANGWVSYLRRHKQFADAIAVLEDALRRYPKSSRATSWWVQIGDIQRADYKDCTQAVQAYMQVAENADGYWGMRARLGLGWCAYSDGDLSLAQEWFHRAMEVAPHYADAYFALANLMRKERRWGEADKWYAKAVEVAPNARWVWLSWADMHRDMKPRDLPRALALYSQTAERFPTWPVVYEHWAWAFHLAGDDAAAAKIMMMAVDKSQRPSANYWASLGFFLEKKGDVSAAVDAYKRALKIDPKNSRAAHALQRLKAKP